MLLPDLEAKHWHCIGQWVSVCHPLPVWPGSGNILTVVKLSRSHCCTPWGPRQELSRSGVQQPSQPPHIQTTQLCDIAEVPLSIIVQWTILCSNVLLVTIHWKEDGSIKTAGVSCSTQTVSDPTAHMTQMLKLRNESSKVKILSETRQIKGLQDDDVKDVHAGKIKSPHKLSVPKLKYFCSQCQKCQNRRKKKKSLQKAGRRKESRYHTRLIKCFLLLCVWCLVCIHL